MTDTISKKVLLIGWDAADWKIIHRLMDGGLMPATKRLVENGVMGNLATLSPVLSPMLWTSIATGKRPFKHGILGFSEPAADRSGVRPVTNLSRKTKAIWNMLSQQGMRTNVVGWWPSHPAEPINGVMVSDFYHRAPKQTKLDWPMLPDVVHPPELAETLAELRVHPMELAPEHVLPFIPHATKVEQDTDRRMSMCLKIIAECTTIHSGATHVMEHTPWDFMAVYYDAIDHFCHGFMKYHPPRQEHISEKDFDLYQNVVSAGYVYHDMMLSRLLELAGDDTTVILMSDHGFHPDHLRPKRLPAEPAGPAAEHREFGIVVICGPGIKQDHLIHGANLLDITPTILTLFGLPVGEDMDGKPLLDAFEKTPAAQSIPSWDEVPGEDGQHPKDRQLDSSESHEAMEQLIALGYIDRPDDNKDKAIAQAERELHYNLARSYMDAGRFGDAVPLFTDLYKNYPLEFRFGIHLAQCYQGLGMHDAMQPLIEDLNIRWRKASQEARKRLKDIAAIAKERRRLLREQKELEKENGKEAKSQPSGRAAKSANSKPKLFNDAEARVVRSLRAIARGNAQTLDYLASTIATSRKDFDEALALLEKTRESQSKAPRFHIDVGNVYLELKRYSEARQCYERALEIDPHHATAYLGLCRVHLKKRRNRKALRTAKEAVGLKFHFPPAHYFLAIAKRRTGDIDGAIDSFKMAISQNPNFPEAHVRLATIYSKQPMGEGLAIEHRSAARQIRAERKLQRKSRKLPPLPSFDDISFDEFLPEFPKPPTRPEHLLPYLAMPTRPKGDAKPSDGDEQTFITIVSGMPRSGTSMMMQMLVAGGLVPLTDDQRAADESNPKGYYELEKVKRLQAENDWLDEGRGKTLKVVAPLVPFLPQGFEYRVIFMQRDMDEILKSRSSMLDQVGFEGGNVADESLSALLARQTEGAMKLLAGHHVPVLSISHADVIQRPDETARSVAKFLDLDLDQAAMSRAVDPTLYRQRRSPVH